MKYAIYRWKRMITQKIYDFDIVTEEGHLYGFEICDFFDNGYKASFYRIVERRFSFNKNLLYNPSDAWVDTEDIKEFSQGVPKQKQFEDALALMLKHIGAENAEEVSIEEINSIIAKI